MTVERSEEEVVGDVTVPDDHRVRAATRVGRDTALFMVGDLFDRGLGFVFLMTATKVFGLEIYGTYLIALGLFQVVRTIVSFGLGRSIVKDTAAAVAVEDLGKLKGAIKLGFLLSLPLSILFAAILLFGAGEVVSVFFPKQPEVVAPLQVFGLLTPLFAFNFVLLQSLYGLGRVRDMVVANNVIEPVTRLVALVALFATGVSGYYAIPGAYAIALVFSSIVALAIFMKNVWPRIAGVTAVMQVKETLAFVVPITLNDLATRSFRTFNIAVFAIYRTASDVSLFNVALKLTGVAMFFSGSLMGAFRPRISALLAQGRNDLLSAETRVYTRWIFTFALLPYGLMIMFPADMLGLLGPQLVPAATPLRILCIGLLIAQAAGPLMALLVMSGRSRQSIGFLACGAVVYTSLAFQLVPRYGMVGGALCGLTTILLLAPIISIYVQRKLKIRLYGRRMVKPFAAAAIAFGAAYLVSLVIPSVPADQGHYLVRIARTVPIILLVLAIYVGVLVKLGIEPEERAVLQPVLAPLLKIRRKLRRLFA